MKFSTLVIQVRGWTGKSVSYITYQDSITSTRPKIHNHLVPLSSGFPYGELNGDCWYTLLCVSQYSNGDWYWYKAWELNHNRELKDEYLRIGIDISSEEREAIDKEYGWPLQPKN